MRLVWLSPLEKKEGDRKIQEGRREEGRGGGMLRVHQKQ